MLRFLTVAFLVGCGLDENGTLVVNDAAIVDVQQNDVVIADVVSEPGPPLPCSTDASACTASVQGWSPIAFEPTRAVACPSNFTTADVVTKPQLQAGACTCDCKVGTPPSCSIGMLSGTFGATNQCSGGSNGPYNITTDGECFDWGSSFSLVPYHDWTRLPLTPGTCASTPTADPNKLTTTSARVCVPSAQCTEDVCSGTVPTGFTSCISSPGDVPACPSGPFTTRVGVIADSFQFTCGTCAGCSLTGTACGAATVDYYNDSSCTTSLASDNVNNTCGFSANGVTSVTHFKYTGTVLNPACTPGTSTPSQSVTTPLTICCRP